MNIRFATAADTGGCLAVYAEYMDTVITFETACAMTSRTSPPSRPTSW